MTVKIKQYDREIQKLTETTYPETQALIKVYGVGHLTALTFVPTLGDKQRFQRSRDVGCYLGLRHWATRQRLSSAKVGSQPGCPRRKPCAKRQSSHTI
jgi:transposase